MNVTKLSCPACTASITLPADTNQLNCDYCATALIIQHSEGHPTLKIAQQLHSTLQNVGEQTQLELKKMQLVQEMSVLQLQLSNIQAEQRALERQPVNWKIKQQMGQLQREEQTKFTHLQQLQARLAALGLPLDTETTPDTLSVKANLSTRDWWTTFLFCLFLGFLGVHRFYTGHIVIGIVQLVTQGGFFLWWLADLILIVTHRYKDVNGRELQNPNLKAGQGCLSAGVVFLILGVCCPLTVIPFLQTILPEEKDRLLVLLPLLYLLAFGCGAAAFVYTLKRDRPSWRLGKESHEKLDGIIQ